MTPRSVKDSWVRSIGLCALVLVLLSACGGDDDSGQGPGPGGTTVSITNNSFGPATLTVAPGTRVTWSWAANALNHNVVPDAAEPLTSGAPRNGPSTFDHTFNTAGTFRYHCVVHGAAGGVGMSGTIVVQ